MKKILMIGLILSMSIFLFACGDDSNSGTSQSQNWSGLEGQELLDAFGESYEPPTSMKVTFKVTAYDVQDELTEMVYVMDEQGNIMLRSSLYGAVLNEWYFADENMWYTYFEGDDYGSKWEDTTSYGSDLDEELTFSSETWGDLESASIEEYEGQEAIHVVETYDIYRSDMWISTETGMVIKLVEVDPDDNITYMMETMESEINGDYSEMMVLPDGIDFQEDSVDY